MDPKIIKAAKEIPMRLKEIVTGMFEESAPTLRAGVAGLRSSLAKVENYLNDVEKEHLASSASAKAERAAAPTAKPGRKKRRGSKRFKTGDFVLTKLTENPKGLRPTNIAKMLSEAAPGAHKNSLSVVNSTLARLKAQKKASNKNGVWTRSK